VGRSTQTDVWLSSVPGTNWNPIVRHEYGEVFEKMAVGIVNRKKGTFVSGIDKKCLKPFI
jgi:hypothetical protein